jgi:hypothetical protein
MPSGRDRLRRQILTLPAVADPGLQQAKVTAVGPPVTVSWQGGSYQFPHLAAYTPAVGDIVAMDRYAGSWLILGKPVDFP